MLVGGREVGARMPYGAPVRVRVAFQNPTMLPWLSIRENVMIPLKIVEPFLHEYSRKKNGEFAERAEPLLEQVGLKGFGDKRPWHAPNGEPWPPRTAYPKNTPFLRNDGNAAAQVAHAGNAAGMHAKMVVLHGLHEYAARKFYMPAPAVVLH